MAIKPIKISSKTFKDKRVIYSISASIVVVLFLIWSMAPMVMNENVPSNVFETQEVRGYDLARMPFDTDLVEGEMLKSEDYKDLKDTKEKNVLYSKKEKSDRSKRDLYAVKDSTDKKKPATKQKSSYTPRQSSYNSSASRPDTTVNQMSGRSFTLGGGGSGGSSTQGVWSGTDKSKSYGGSYKSVGSSGINLSSKDKVDMAKQIALQRAGKLSEQAAASDGADAAGKAAEAFSGGEASADLETDLEAAADELDLADGDLSGLGEGNIPDAIDSAVDDAEDEIVRSSSNTAEGYNPWQQFWMDSLGNFIGNIPNMLGTLADMSVQKQELKYQHQQEILKQQYQQQQNASKGGSGGTGGPAGDAGDVNWGNFGFDYDSGGGYDYGGSEGQG